MNPSMTIYSKIPKLSDMIAARIFQLREIANVILNSQPIVLFYGKSSMDGEAEDDQE